jgi:hypothetical protein
MRVVCRTTVILIAFGCWLPSGLVAAQEQPEYGPILEARVQTFKSSGGSGGSATASDPVVAGQGRTWYLSAGQSNSGEMTLCTVGAADSGALADKLSRSALVWELKVGPTKYENGNTTFDLDWARYQADGAGRPTVEGRSTLTLREGERKTLDFIRVPGMRGCENDSAVVDVAAGYKEDRRFADTVLQYEMWLTHRRSNGDAVVRRFTGMGRQGDGVDFSFVPVRSAIDVSTPDRAAYDVFTTVLGTIRGRMQSNGRIALTVDTSRRDGLGPQTAGPSGGVIGNGGRKLLDVAPGETIEIELPAPGGRSMIGARGAAAAPRGGAPAPSQSAASVANGRVVVDNAVFFQGQRTSLIVQVKPVRE